MGGGQEKKEERGYADTRAHTNAFEVSFEEPPDEGLLPSNFDIRNEFTVEAVRYACLQLCAEMDMYLLICLPTCFMAILGALAYRAGLHNIFDRMMLDDHKVLLELYDAVTSSSTCWQFYAGNSAKQDPALLALEPRAPTLCGSQLASSDRELASSRVPALVFVTVLAVLAMAAAFFLRYLLAGLDVLRQWFLSSRREMSGRGRVAKSMSGIGG